MMESGFFESDVDVECVDTVIEESPAGLEERYEARLSDLLLSVSVCVVFESLVPGFPIYVESHWKSGLGKEARGTIFGGEEFHNARYLCCLIHIIRRISSGSFVNCGKSWSPARETTWVVDDIVLSEDRAILQLEKFQNEISFTREEACFEQ